MSAMVTATVQSKTAQTAVVLIAGVPTFAMLYGRGGSRFRQLQVGDTCAVDVSGGVAAVVQSGPAP